MKLLKKILIIISVILLIFIGVFFAYLNIGQYNATTNAINKYEGKIVEHSKYYEFDNNATKGLIFYPGAKVDPQAYNYLSEISNANIYILRPYYNIAFLNMNLADKVIEEQTNETQWYVGGHSLGGVAASTYAQSNSDIIDGVVLLGSYPASKLTNNSIPYLSLYGTNDKVVGNYEEKEVLFDENANIVAIDGGNHSQFGDYGFQKNDGEASISSDVEHEFIVSQIENFIKEN